MMLHRVRRPSLILFVGVALVLFLAPAAVAAEGSSGHGAGHAQARPDDRSPGTPNGGADHAPMTTPTSEPKHNGIHGDAEGMTEDRRDEAPAGEQHRSHGAGEAPPKDRPRALVLGSFAGLNVLVLVAAAAVRHRDRIRRTRAAPAAG